MAVQPALTVVTAGLTVPSSTRLLADRLTEAVVQDLAGEGVATTVEVIELRDHAKDLANNLLTGFPSPALAAAIESVLRADGLIAISPIFAASYSGLFKSFFDVLEADSLTGKPVLIAATGGTARHSLALEHAFRPLFAYLRAVVMPTAVFAASEDWGAASGPSGSLAARVERAAGELAGLVQAGHGGPVDPFAAPVPFERLLGGGG